MFPIVYGDIHLTSIYADNMLCLNKYVSKHKVTKPKLKRKKLLYITYVEVATSEFDRNPR